MATTTTLWRQERREESSEYSLLLLHSHSVNLIQRERKEEREKEGGRYCERNPRDRQ